MELEPGTVLRVPCHGKDIETLRPARIQSGFGPRMMNVK